MKYLKFILPLAFLSLNASAQTTIKQDATIKSMVDEVSVKNIEATIRKLVTFKTRDTIGDTTSKTEGPGAARNWIKSKYELYAKESGGRMTVAFDTFTQPKANRIPNPIFLKNVLATLKGTDPTDTRIYIVSGHFDSIVGDVLDSKADAPGANDDASGTAVSMELAREMAKHSIPATVIFLAFCGEEQGLDGSAHVAKRAKAEKWNVDAMLNNDIVGNTHGLDNDIKDNRHVRVFSEGIPTGTTQQQLTRLINNGGEDDSPSRELARYIKEIGERYVDNLDVKLIYRRDRYGRGGDHTSFLQQGFTAVRFTEMNENFTRQHQYVRRENEIGYGDVPDSVDYSYVQKVARMNLSVLSNLASAPAAPSAVTMT